jgi:hypothetical protein
MYEDICGPGGEEAPLLFLQDATLIWLVVVEQSMKYKMEASH